MSSGSVRVARGQVVGALPAVLTIAATLLLVPLGARSVVLGIGLVCALFGLVLVVVGGFEGAGVVLLMLGTALSPLDGWRPIGPLSFTSTSDIVLLLGVIVLVPVLLTRPAPSAAVFVTAAGLLVVVGLISSAIADEPGASLNSLLRLVFGALLLPVVYAIWRPGVKVALWLAASYVAGSAANVVLAFTNGAVGDGGRRIGYSTHPNVYGLCAMLAVALVPLLVAALRRNDLKALVVVLAGVNAVGVWTSGSRAALVALAAVAVLYPLVARSVPVALGLAGLSIAPLYFVGQAIGQQASSDNALGRLLGGGSAQGSDQARELLAEEAWQVFLDKPVLGEGLARAMEAHNIYLQVAAALGIIGTALFVVLLGSVVARALALPSPASMLVLPCIGYAMVGLMTTFLWDRFVWCVLALPFLVLAGRAVDEEPDEPDDTDVEQDVTTEHGGTIDGAVTIPRHLLEEKLP